MDKSHNLTLYMERAERSLRLIKFKAPTAIVANDIRLVRESATLLAGMAGDGLARPGTARNGEERRGSQGQVGNA